MKILIKALVFVITIINSRHTAIEEEDTDRHLFVVYLKRRCCRLKLNNVTSRTNRSTPDKICFQQEWVCNGSCERGSSIH